MPKFGKHMRKAIEAMDKTKAYQAREAIDLLMSHKRPKFNETFEISLNLGIDPRHADQQVRGVVALPHGSGQNIKVAVFARDEKANEANAAGADFVGAEDLMKKIQDGFMDFDRCIATPDMMAIVGRLGKILGPRNLMPNPKLGTVTQDIAAAVTSAKSGEVQFRAEKAGVVHAGIGKMSFSADELEANLRSFMRAIQSAKPSGAKGSYIKRVSLSSTMGVGIKLSMADLL